MKPLPRFPEEKLTRMREAAHVEHRLAAIYVFAMHQPGDCDMAALFTQTPPWPERLELEISIARTLGLDGVQLVDLRRVPLAFRFWVVNNGQPIYVGRPQVLATFIEETIVRYAAFYPLLQALYWKVETSPLADDMLDH